MQDVARKLCAGAAAVAVMIGAGCAPDDTAKAKAAVDKTIADANTLAKEGADATDRAAAAAKESSEVASAWASDIKRSSGELSATASHWIDDAAALAKGSEATIESILASGTQIAPTAVEIGASLSSAVDRDTVFEPIFQRVDAPAAEGGALRTSEEADKAIAAMPRVEVIDGLTIGFKDLTSTTAKERVTESGYLVIWRKDGYLVGFVYRSRQEVDLERLVADAPRLIGLVQAAL